MNPIRVLKAVYGGDVGMVERGQKLCLSLKTSQPLGILGESLRKDLDGDFPFQSGVFGPVDLSHATFTEFLQDAIVRDALAYQKRLQGKGESI